MRAPLPLLRRSPSSGHKLGVLAVCALLMVLGAACSASDHAQTSWLEDGERLPGGATTNTLLFGRNAFIRPAENILPEHEPRFYSGNSFFNQAWVQSPASTKNRDGLGPLFNARSCAACHLRDGRGQPPTSLEEPFLGLLLRVSLPGEDGAPIPTPAHGSQIQPFAIADVPHEGTPQVRYEELQGTYEDGTPYTLLAPTYSVLDHEGHPPLPEQALIGPRIAPQVIGLGLLEAIPEARLEALADAQDANNDGISGRLHRVPDLITNTPGHAGRFGWKAEQPGVRQQVAAAFLNDMGITSPVLGTGECESAQLDCERARAASEDPLDIQEENFERVVLYASLLAVPARRNLDDARVREGKELFEQAQCQLCHVPSHTTSAVTEYPEVASQRIFPYTDLLLHDLGEGLSDGRPVLDASGREWRTPPLWGLGLVQAVNGHTRLLHDGRARGFAEAILWHGGEAQGSREAFVAMDAEEREALITFLESL